MNKYKEKSEENQESDFNIREQVEKYFIHWRWFILAIIVSLTVSFIYLRYATPLYKATTTILVKDEKRVVV